MSDPKPPVFSFRPVLRFAIVVGVGRNHLSLEHHRIHIEVVLVSDSKKPDIFRTILPVRLRATPFLAFPCDPVLGNEIFLANTLNRRRAPPVAAYINRRGG